MHPGRRGGAGAARAAAAGARPARWDVIVVDCAPTAETLRLLALPEALGWYMHRVLPGRAAGGQGAAAGADPGRRRPDAGRQRLRRGRAAARRARRGPRAAGGPDASVRLVLTPENVVLAEARRSYTTLSLFGYRVDGVVANRVFPARRRRRLARRLGGGPGRGARPGRPSRSPGCRSGARSTAPASRSGSRRCAELARELYDGDRPAAPRRPGTGPFRITRTGPAPCCASRCRTSRAPRSTWHATATIWS